MNYLNVVGLVLAGGKSRRMGRDKAAVVLKSGKTLLEECFDKLSRISSPCLVSASRPYGGYPLLADARENAGPLGGITAGLRYAEKLGARGIITLACDMPFMPAGALAVLAASEAPAALYVNPANGKTETLAAYYSLALLWRFERALAAELPSLRRILEAVNIARLPWRGEVGVFFNCNRPRDLRGL